MSENGHTAVDRLDSVHGEGGSNVTSIRLIGYDRPFFIALSVAISLVAAMFCFFTYSQENRRVYYTMRCEGFVEQLAFTQKPVSPKYIKSICGPREN